MMTLPLNIPGYYELPSSGATFSPVLFALQALVVLGIAAALLLVGILARRRALRLAAPVTVQAAPERPVQAPESRAQALAAERAWSS